jgi:hypothetical protein
VLESCLTKTNLSTSVMPRWITSGRRIRAFEIFRASSRVVSARFVFLFSCYLLSLVLYSSQYQTLSASKGARVLHPFEIIVPFYNFNISYCLTSIFKQRYEGQVRLWLLDDGSSSLSQTELCQEWTHISEDFSEEHLPQLLDRTAYHGSVICMRISHGGPAKAKYFAFVAIKTVADRSAIIFVIDGDDSLIGLDALGTINEYYVDAPVISAYGSYRGSFSDTVVPIQMTEAQALFMPRHEQDWRYGHPRTFKAVVLDHIHVNDFQTDDGEWIQRATDRAYFYRALELSGPNRVAFGWKQIYYYASHEKSSRLVVPSHILNRDLHYIKNLPPSLTLPRSVLILVRAERSSVDLYKYRLLGEKLSIDISFHVFGRHGSETVSRSRTHMLSTEIFLTQDQSLRSATPYFTFVKLCCNNIIKAFYDTVIFLEGDESVEQLSARVMNAKSQFSSEELLKNAVTLYSLQKYDHRHSFDARICYVHDLFDD